MLDKPKEDKIDISKTYVPIQVTVIVILFFVTTITSFLANKYTSQSVTMEHDFKTELTLSKMQNDYFTLNNKSINLENLLSKTIDKLDKSYSDINYLKEEIIRLNSNKSYEK